MYELCPNLQPGKQNVRRTDREALQRALHAGGRARHVEVQARRGRGSRQARHQERIQVGPTGFKPENL